MTSEPLKQCLPGQEDPTPSQRIRFQLTEQRIPGPPRSPLLWSETRQELCESLPYYRSFHAGTYSLNPPNTSIKPNKSTFQLPKDRTQPCIFKDGTPYAYLLAAWPSQRDVWSQQGKVIISHGGGKSTGSDRDGASSTASKSFCLSDDQKEQDPTIASLINSMRTGLPIVLIAGENYALIPFNLNCAYAVLGWYTITDGWAEKEAGGKDGKYFVRWKFRFEFATPPFLSPNRYIETQGKPWWLDEETNDPVRRTWNPRERIESLPQKDQEEGWKVVSANQLSIDLSSKDVVSPDLPHMRPTMMRGPLIPPDGLESVESKLAFSPTRKDCRICSQHSPGVYKVGWMCLQPNCPAFWEVEGRAPDPDSLEFVPTFLSTRPTPRQFCLARLPFDLRPVWPARDTTDQARGLYCYTCGRLNCKELFHSPICCHCGTVLGNNPMAKVSPPLPDPVEMEINDPVLAKSSGITRRVWITSEGIKVESFHFPRAFGDSRVHLVRREGLEDGMADDIFRGLQFNSHDLGVEEEEQGLEGEGSRGLLPMTTSLGPPPSYPSRGEGDERIPFRRHPLKHHGMRGKLLSQQFTCNYGKAYKHVVEMETNPLDHHSPKAIRDSMELIVQRTSAALSSETLQLSEKEEDGASKGGKLQEDTFNELYPVLYLDHQKMNFHDDGEPGLGPVISTLSLGAPAIMNFRIKEKYVKNHDTPCTGCDRGEEEEEEKRREKVNESRRSSHMEALPDPSASDPSLRTVELDDTGILDEEDAPLRKMERDEDQPTKKSKKKRKSEEKGKEKKKKKARKETAENLEKESKVYFTGIPNGSKHPSSCEKARCVEEGKAKVRSRTALPRTETIEASNLLTSGDPGNQSCREAPSHLGRKGSRKRRMSDEDPIGPSLDTSLSKDQAQDPDPPKQGSTKIDPHQDQVPPTEPSSSSQPRTTTTSKDQRVFLSLYLPHGSICIQQGRDLQKFFQHSVQPKGFRIAITARRID
ncbi:hypothetical protein IE53DRAFT_368870 [Violaceomyces palustris]|uniref:Uncharacterized protein n=1 Tax=Violaceomyces palustris TaxID=1673888 RepID=A0ACD0NXJ6_9BASI|nr:hypothetical protein IE53DRAFT_368870 [Violaceomyces palustris]